MMMTFCLFAFYLVRDLGNEATMVIPDGDAAFLSPCFTVIDLSVVDDYLRTDS